MKKMLWLLPFLFFTIQVRAVVIYVDSANNNSYQDGTSWSLAYPDLQTAIDNAGFGDSIWVAMGTYRPATSFSMKEGVKILGGFVNTDINISQRNWTVNTTSIKGNSDYPAIYNYLNPLTNASVIDGFVITSDSGTAFFDGVGINNYFSSPTISNCSFIGLKTYDNGAAISNYRCSPQIKNCTFKDNKSNKGGAVATSNMMTVVNYVTILNCIFENNYSNYGGAMFNEGNEMIMEDCSFSNNFGYYGGAIYNSATDFNRFERCSFDHNMAGNGGGAMYCITTVAKLHDCSFTGNKCDTFYNNNGGGAIFTMLNGIIGFSNPGLIIDSCVFSGNAAIGTKGGAICNMASGSDSGTSIRNCVFINDSASYGGAIYSENCTPLIVNSIIAKNFSDSFGGAIFNDSGSMVRIVNCTIARNVSLLDSNSIYNQHTSSSSINNCIVSGNSGGVYSAGSASTNLNFSLIQGYPANPAFHMLSGNLNPMFIDTSSNDFHLQSNSPCIDAGNNQLLPFNINTDIAGNLRITGNAVDLGAYESMSLAGVTNVTSSNKGFTLSPNPTRNMVAIKTNHDNLPTTGVLTSLSGNRIKTIEIQNENELMSMADLPAGIYLFYESNSKLSYKVIKE